MSADGPLKLRSLKSFKDFSDDHLHTFEQFLEENDYRDGQMIYHQGRKERPGKSGIHIILTGKVSIYTDVEEKNRVPISRLMEAGEVFGLVSFVTGISHTANCKADGETRLATLSQEEFTRLRGIHPDLVVTFQMIIARQLARDLRMANRRLTEALQKVIKWEDLPGVGRK